MFGSPRSWHPSPSVATAIPRGHPQREVEGRGPPSATAASASWTLSAWLRMGGVEPAIGTARAARGPADWAGGNAAGGRRRRTRETDNVSYVNLTAEAAGLGVWAKDGPPALRLSSMLGCAARTSPCGPTPASATTGFAQTTPLTPEGARKESGGFPGTHRQENPAGPGRSPSLIVYPSPAPHRCTGSAAAHRTAALKPAASPAGVIARAGGI